MKRWAATLIVLSSLVLIDCEAGPNVTREREYVSAHEQPLRALAEEWLSEGPFVMAHGDLAVPFGGSAREVQTVPDVWWVVPPANDWRDAMYHGMWLWRAHDDGWWIQNPRHVETGGVPFRAARLDDVESGLNISEGRMARWMEQLSRNAIRRIELDGVGRESVHITFTDSTLKSVFFIPRVRQRADGCPTGFVFLTERWYYYADPPGCRPSQSDPL